MAKTKRGLTEAERAERRARDRERLQQAARELLTSDGWQHWVRARALFHNPCLLNSGGGCRQRSGSGDERRRHVARERLRTWLTLICLALASPLSGCVERRMIERVLALRVLFTVVVMAGCVWLLATGRPLGGLLILPALAVWVRHAAESGRLTRFSSRFARPS